SSPVFGPQRNHYRVPHAENNICEWVGNRYVARSLGITDGLFVFGEFLEGILPGTISKISKTNNVLFAYMNITNLVPDEEGPIQRDTWAGIADENGNLLQRMLLVENENFDDIDDIFGVKSRGRQLVVNGDNFIYVYYQKITDQCKTIVWKVYRNMTLVGSNRYNTTVEQGCVRSYSAEPTMDGGFLIVWSVTISPNSTSLQTQSQVYAVFLMPDFAYVKTNPFVIFSGFMAYEIKILACAGSKFGQGFNCFLRLRTDISENDAQPYQVTFLSSGMIYDVIRLGSNITDIQPSFEDFLDVMVLPLEYGGFLLVYSSLRQGFDYEDSFARGILNIFSTDGKLVREQTTREVYTGGACIFPNNTAVLTGIPSDWWNSTSPRGYAIYTIDLPRFHDKDNGYQNPNILSSEPAVKATNVPTTSDSTSFFLSLNYRGQVVLSGRGSIN
ncbi:7073_t:CDS:2, partial [Acaulospora morrowiae]